MTRILVATDDAAINDPFTLNQVERLIIKSLLYLTAEHAIVITRKQYDQATKWFKEVNDGTHDVAYDFDENEVAIRLVEIPHPNLES